MSFTRREELRATFEDVGAIYDRARPRYPRVLFDDIFQITRLTPPARLLEIGPGTGFATAVFAELGFQIVGVEPEESMAAVARETVGQSPAVEIIVNSFETFEPSGLFDAVVAFSAFHWVDPTVGYKKVASVLRESGFFVVADARLVGGDDPFFVEVEDDYYTALGDSANDEGAPSLTSLRNEMQRTGFSHLSERRYRWDVSYTDTAYVELLDTFPWYRSLDENRREALYRLIRERIQKRPARTVIGTFEAVLDVARRM